MHQYINNKTLSSGNISAVNHSASFGRAINIERRKQRMKDDQFLISCQHHGHQTQEHMLGQLLSGIGKDIVHTLQQVPFQHLSGAIYKSHRKPKSRWLEAGLNCCSPECESSVTYQCTYLLSGIAGKCHHHKAMYGVGISKCHWVQHI